MALKILRSLDAHGSVSLAKLLPQVNLLIRDASRMANTLLITPFAARTQCLPGGTHFVTDKIKFEAMPDAIKIAVSDYLDEIEEAELGRLVRLRPAFTIPVNDVPTLKALSSKEERCSLALQMHRFCLEYFALRPVPMIAFMHDGKKIVHHEIDRDGLLFSEKGEIGFSAEAWEKQLAYAKFAYEAAEKSPAFEPIVTRLCRAFREGPTPDGMIDLAIAMEGLVQTKIEIKFQFSLFNSLISSSDLDIRQNRFQLLRSLYDARSLVVHGGKPSASEKRKIDKVVEEWDALIALARGNLTYYLNFCAQNSHKDWGDHLWWLALGAKRFTPEDAA